jgi:hypothetical protein
VVPWGVVIGFEVRGSAEVGAVVQVFPARWVSLYATFRTIAPGSQYPLRPILREIERRYAPCQIVWAPDVP